MQTMTRVIALSEEYEVRYKIEANTIKVASGSRWRDDAKDHDTKSHWNSLPCEFNDTFFLPESTTIVDGMDHATYTTSLKMYGRRSCGHAA